MHSQVMEMLRRCLSPKQLHHLQLEKKYLTHYPKDGMNRLEKMLKNGEISITSQQADITDILKVVDDRIHRKRQRGLAECCASPRDWAGADGTA